MIIRCSYHKLISIEELKSKFNPKNSNGHPKEQIIEFAEILKYQGTRVPARISNRSGLMTAGHGRVLSAELAGWTEYPTDFQDYDDEAMEIADMTADNALQLWSALDYNKIRESIKDLTNLDPRMLGIKDFVIPDIITMEPGCDEDAVPENVEPKTKLGDLYKLGNHRLLCGDSTSIDAVEKLMGGEKADMVFTDPPYGYRYESNRQDKHKMLQNDDKILDFLPCAYSVMKEDSAIYLFGSHQTIHLWRPLIDQNFTYKNLIVWKKNSWSMGDLKGSFAGQHELILFAHKGKVKLRGERSRDVWEFDRDPPKDHPTQKPIPLVVFAIEKVSENGQFVLDLFGGSGSTIIACEKTNRKCFTMELDPKYCDVIVARWEKYTGKKAELIDAG